VKAKRFLQIGVFPVRSKNNASLVEENVGEGLGALIRETVSDCCKVYEDIRERWLPY
jgi:hypothetical protein